MTAGNDRITLFVAFNYGGRAEIVDAARTFTGGDEEEFRAHLYAPDMHDPDLIIRTSGEQRISNYLLWQGAYSELVFRDELWPDFSREAFEQSLERVRGAQAALRGPLDGRRARAGRAGPRRSGSSQRPARPRRAHRDRRRSASSERPQRARAPQAAGAARTCCCASWWRPAAVLAIVFVDIGGIAFALFMIVIGWLSACTSSTGMLDRWRPVPLVGFAALAGDGARGSTTAVNAQVARGRWRPRCRCCSC